MQATQDTDTTRRTPSIKEIRSLVGDDLKEFRRYFREAMRSDVALLDRVIRYLLRQKGKELRPMLVILSARAAGGMTESTYRGAALIELLHTATLVHDDVVDDADRRRGLFSINNLFKNKIAVLLGDFLLSRGLLLALDHEEYELLQVVSTAVKRMSEGELLQIEKARKLDIDEKTYFRIISDKTASLISACTAVGAVSARADDEAVEILREFGEKLGLAFQIRDDLFDFGVRDVGKPIGIDVQEKKLTLPLIHALQGAPSDDRKRIMRIIRRKKKSRTELRTVADFARQRGGVDYATTRMVELANQAQSLLGKLPPTPARDALEELVAYTVSRKR